MHAVTTKMFICNHSQMANHHYSSNPRFTVKKLLTTPHLCLNMVLHKVNSSESTSSCS